MAPRGRPRKDNARMTAAIEAMTKEYGFSDEELVRKVTNDLLKEYGGDQGWFFIEQYYYQELLDALLRYQEQTDQKKPEPDERDDLPEPQPSKNDDNPDQLGNSIEKESVAVENPERHAITDVAGRSGIAAEAICSESFKIGRDDHTTNRQQHTEGQQKSWKDIVLDEASSQRDGADAAIANDKDECSESPIHHESIGAPPLPATPVGIRPVTPVLLSPSPRIFSSAPPPPPPLPMTAGAGLPSKRRQPCYGWIDSDEGDTDDDFIELTPAAECDDSSPGQAHRQSRWDLRPDDP